MSQCENYEEKYLKLLDEFNDYREKIQIGKEKELAELEKYRAHLDKSYKQMQKKYEGKLQQDRVAYEKKVQRMEDMIKAREVEWNSLIDRKNKFIDEIKRKLMESQREKSEIVEQNTKLLYELAEDI